MSTTSAQSLPARSSGSRLLAGFASLAILLPRGFVAPSRLLASLDALPEFSHSSLTEVAERSPPRMSARRGRVRLNKRTFRRYTSTRYSHYVALALGGVGVILLFVMLSWPKKFRKGR